MPSALFLRTKLLPPRPAPSLLSRQRLTGQLLGNLTQPVTLVTANAGSGKTTLVADFVRRHVPKFVWYQLDHTDADPLVFLGYVVHGIRQILPNFGQSLLSYLQQSADEIGRQPERAVDVLLNEIMENVEERFLIVLDDYHHLGTETPVHRILDRLLAYIPDLLHIIIISRDVPPLQLTRLRSHGSLAIIDRDDLLFTDEETRALFRQVFDLELTPEQMTEYRQRTQGWITALQLIRQVAQRQTLTSEGSERSLDMTKILKQSEHDIFDYFAEEVFVDESPSTQFLLLHASLPDRIDLAQCGRLYPDADYRTQFPILAKRNVFVTIASDSKGEEYRLHPLFQDFLRRHLRAEIGQAGVASENARYGQDFLEQDRPELAIRHFVHAGQYDRAASVLASRGRTWLESGAFSSLINSTRSLPQSALEDEPLGLFYYGEALRLRGEYGPSQITLQRAATLLKDTSDSEGEADALHSLAAIVRRRGEYSTAFRYLDRALELCDEKSPVRVKCGNTRGLCFFSTGDLFAAEREFKSAWQFAVERGDSNYIRLIGHNRGLPPLVRGDFGEAARLLKGMLGDAEDAKPLPRDATAHLNLARCHLYRGGFAACEQQLNLALECSQSFNLVLLNGDIFETYGNYYRELGDYTHAAEYYERATRAYESAEMDVTQHEVLEEKALLALRMGDLSSARHMIDRLIEAREVGDNELRVASAKLARGRILIAQSEMQLAWDELKPTAWFFRQRELKYYEAQASMAMAECAFHLQLSPDMLRSLRRAIDLAARYDYEYWLQVEVRRNAQLFALPEAKELLPEDLREQLPAQPEKAAVSVTVSSSSAQTVTDLTINMLGPIEIYRDRTRPFAADAWTTKRARDILCFIASQRHRRAQKDTIIDTFWGEADFAAIEKNFHPTVSHIRKALNSNQPLKINFLMFRDNAYQLNPDSSYCIDIEEFDKLVAKGDAAKRSGDLQECAKCFEEAIALYRGEFMSGVYDEWVENQRAYYQEQNLRLLEELAKLSVRAADWPKSLQLAHRILREDQLREDIHCIVMRALAAQGHRGAVKEQYESLRHILKEELGVEPAAETQRVYNELLQG